MNISELENTILDQIEKLSDDSIGDDVEQIRMMIDRSKSMTDLTNAFIGIQRFKLDAVKHLEKNGGLYESYLGIEDKNGKHTKSLGQY